MRREADHYPVCLACDRGRMMMLWREREAGFTAARPQLSNPAEAFVAYCARRASG